MLQRITIKIYGVIITKISYNIEDYLIKGVIYMPDIREYLRNKRKNANVDTYKRKLFVHKAAVMYRFIIIGVVAIAVIMGIYVYLQNKVYTEYSIISEVERSDSSSTQYEKYNSYIIKYNNDGISCTDYSDNVIWNQPYEMQNPIVDICEDFVAVGDKDGTQIYVLDKSGVRNELNVKLPIKQFKVAEQGVIYAVLEDGNTSWIYAYDLEGNILVKMKQPLSSSGYPLDIDITSLGDKLVVSYLYVDSGIMETHIAFYNFGSVGQNESDHLVSAYEYDGIIYPQVIFVDETTAIAIGDSKISIFKGSQKPELAKDIDISEEIKSAYCSDNYIGLVFNNTDGDEKYRFDLYDLEGNKAASLKINTEYSSIELYSENFIINNETEFSMYNMEGLEKFHYTSTDSILSVIKVEDKNRFVIIDSGDTKVINLKLN